MSFYVEDISTFLLKLSYYSSVKDRMNLPSTEKIIVYIEISETKEVFEEKHMKLRILCDNPSG